MRRLRILVVDDQPSLLLTYRLILAQRGHDVTTAGTHSEALEHVSCSEFDALLCDLSLDEGCSGLDVIEAARKRRSETFAALLTGHDSEHLRRLALKDNIALLLKPVPVPQLIEVLEGMNGRANIAAAS